MEELEIQMVEQLKAPKTTKIEVDSFIKKYNLKLPKEYIEFLYIYNGGRPVKNKFTFISSTIKSNPNTASMVDDFYGINDENDKISHLERVLKVFKDRIPKEFLTIGCDPGGNQILISLKDGSIHFWDHNFEEEEPTMKNISFISKNFSEFINSLYAGEDADQNEWDDNLENE
ncbi:MAG TPA: SMI1/KNR4 family protein [Leptospiraceae bacterium]|nr:SMI1/KNR4 family protein [Leptospiraceae bacterium]